MGNKIVQALSELMKVQGVSTVAIVGRDGFVIESIQSGDIDMDALSAMVATAVGIAENLGREFDFGVMNQYLSEFDTGKVLMAKAGEDILAVFTDDSAIIGGVRFAVKKNISNIIESLT